MIEDAFRSTRYYATFNAHIHICIRNTIHMLFELWRVEFLTYLNALVLVVISLRVCILSHAHHAICSYTSKARAYHSSDWLCSTRISGQQCPKA